MLATNLGFGKSHVLTVDINKIINKVAKDLLS